MDKAPEDEYVIEIRGSNGVQCANIAQAIEYFLTQVYKGVGVRRSRNLISHIIAGQDRPELELSKNIFLTTDKRNESSN